ncbi:MAG TPA: ABC transporter substrate-binding protein [Jatrophihabitantaceae bacterium]|nr:ABC transporter substrate-binding protein [Jatrophihabitantaceae bacterium]
MSSRPLSMAGTVRAVRLRRPKSLKIIAALAAIAALTLSGCTTSSGGSSNSKSSGGTFTIGIGVALDTLDPAQQTTTTVQNVIDYGLQTLVTFDKNGKLQPMLATSWTTAKDGLSLTLKLRTGVKFHDGTPFNAQAVKFSLGRLIDPKIKVPIGAAFQVIKSIDAVDDSTVRINLKEVDPNLLPNLGVTVAAILSPASATKDGNSYTNIVHPVGTGPYEYVSRQEGSEVTYQRAADYWGDKPYYSKVVFKIIPEATSREAGLRSGQLDMIMNPSVSDLQSLEASGDITVVKAPSDRSIFIAFNNAKAPFTNPQVRQAFNYAVDKKAIIEHVLFGAVDQMDSPFPSSVAGYCKTGDYAYDPAKAKQLLKDSGVGPITVTMGSPTGRYLQDLQVSQAIAGYLRKVGVKVNVKTMDWPSYVTAMQDKNGPFDLHLLGWAPGALDAPTQMEMFDKASMAPAGLNNSFYSDPQVETMFDQASKNLDESSRNAQYCQIQQKIWQDAPWIFLWSQTLILAYKSNIDGISYQPNEKFETINAHPK